MLIKILSAVINDWERIKVIVSGGCCLDINIIRKMDLKIKILSLLSFRSLEWQENEELSTGGKAGKKWRKSAKK